MGNQDLNDDLEQNEIAQLIEEEISSAPKAPSELEERLEMNRAASPRDSGGDIDASWEEVNTSGAEAVFGHNPTPDQSDVEDNAHAMGIDFADNEPLDFVEKLEKRDRNRFELDEGSKSGKDTI
ncbi:MAG: DUF6335 family protein [Pyrinomonadaceae bacterium]|nr:DUF6335 family protein [Pyrinomonadaceae bacterium]